MGSVKFINRIGETNIATNGQKMTIIAYRDTKDMDIQFEDDTIVYHKSYQQFKIGKIKNPNKPYKVPIRTNHLGETNRAKNGQLMTIIRYNGWRDIDVRFEDDIIATNKRYDAFLRGEIYNSNCVPTRTCIHRIGEVNKSTIGLLMKIIAYREYNDMDVQFEDGEILYHVDYKDFTNGTLQHPKINSQNYRAKQKHIGETFVASCGLKLTIIDYINSDNVIIKFEDNIIVSNLKYINVKNGRVKHPNYPYRKNEKAYHKYINQTFLTKKDGIYATVIDYITWDKITVKYETGYITQNKITNIRKKHHPFPYQMDNIKLEKVAYLDSDGIGNFYCTCTKCGHQDIWTLEEAKNHICEVSNE